MTDAVAFDPVERAFLLCLDQVTFRLTVDARLAGLGLAAVQIGTLLGTHLAVSPDGLVHADPIAAPPAAVLQRQTFAAIVHEAAPAPVRDWLTDLAARGLLQDVAAQLVDRGVIEIHRPRLRIGRPVYEPHKPEQVWRPTSILREGFRRPDRVLPAGHEAFTAACMVAIGVRLLDGSVAIDRYRQATAAMHPVYHQLVIHLRTAVAAAAMT